MVEHLPNMHKTLGSISTTKTKKVVKDQKKKNGKAFLGFNPQCWEKQKQTRMAFIAIYYSITYSNKENNLNAQH